MKDMREFYRWLLLEARGEREGNPVAELAMHVIKPGNSKEFQRAGTLEQWRRLLPPEWRGEVSALYRLYRGFPISDLDFLV